MIALFVITPTLSLKLKIHEALLLTVINATRSFGMIIFAFAVEIWQGW